MIGYMLLSDKKAKWYENSIKITKSEFTQNAIEIVLDLQNEKKENKCIKKLLKWKKKYLINDIVLEKDIISKKKNFIEQLRKNNFNIIDGKELYERLIYKIIQYIFDNAKNININQMSLGLGINAISSERIDMIKRLASDVKNVTIYTKNVEMFSNISKEIIENDGTMVKVISTPKNSLNKCDIIINFDMETKTIVNNISNNSILINFSNKDFKVKQTFKGIIINDIEIDLKDNYDTIYLEKFNCLQLAQTLNLKEEEVNISKLIGQEDYIDKAVLNIFKLKNKNVI